ncbi:MAG: hypothetical protein HUU22_03705 [Phycisphaerae bacterium]|nr:hypothetical protein [Phycisphaerae bacterium]NUQ45121.1 hypothetical protein [Phycisphaerae bacterium]
MDRDDRLFVPADRVAALMRGGWRMLCAVLLSGSGWLVYRGIDWPLMWRTEPLSCTALAVAAALPAVLGLLATFAAVRWLLVTLWPARLGVEWSADAIRWRLGPFGHGRLDALGLRRPGEDDDDFVDDGESPPPLTHPDYPGNAAELFLRYTRITAGQLRATILARLP